MFVFLLVGSPGKRIRRVSISDVGKNRINCKQAESQSTLRRRLVSKSTRQAKKALLLTNHQLYHPNKFYYNFPLESPNNVCSNNQNFLIIKFKVNFIKVYR